MKRSDIVAKAREYLDTPFRHQGRLKGIALDCVGLPVCVGEDLCLMDKLGVLVKRTDYANYSAQPLDAFVHTEMQRRLTQKPQGSALEPGDIVTLAVPRVPCHVAIIGSAGPGGFAYLTMIHAYEGFVTKTHPKGKCVEHVLDKKWVRRIVGIFSFEGVE